MHARWCCAPPQLVEDRRAALRRRMHAGRIMSCAICSCQSEGGFFPFMIGRPRGEQKLPEDSQNAERRESRDDLIVVQYAIDRDRVE